MSPLDWAVAQLGRRLTAPGGLGGQCVDAVNVYLGQCYGLDPVRLDALNWAQAELLGWRWVANDPVNMPPLGAICVWLPTPALGVGAYGHVAIVLQSSVMHLLSADQNWGVESLQLIPHSYEGVVGWWQRGG